MKTLHWGPVWREPSISKRAKCLEETVKSRDTEIVCLMTEWSQSLLPTWKFQGRLRMLIVIYDHNMIIDSFEFYGMILHKKEEFEKLKFILVATSRSLFEFQRNFFGSSQDCAFQKVRFSTLTSSSTLLMPRKSRAIVQLNDINLVELWIRNLLDVSHLPKNRQTMIGNSIIID